MENGVYASLDIGTTSIKVVIADVVQGELNVIGVGNEESKGLKRGMIVDIDETVSAIKSAVKQAEENSGKQINKLIVGVPANDVKIEPCHGVVSISQEYNSEITDNDVIDVVNESLNEIDLNDQTLLSVMFEEFIVDGFDEITDPRGMVGKSMEMYGTVLSAPKTILHNIKKCVERSGYEIANFILHPQAMSEVALSQEERSFGTITLDIGGGQTTVSVVHDEQIKFSELIQEGGNFITKDISIVLNTSLKSAERLKREIGLTGLNQTSTVLVDTVGKDEPVKVEETFISEIIEARLTQIFEQVKEPLNEIGAFELPGGIVVSGGSSTLPGLNQLLEKFFDVRTTIYVPDYMSARMPSLTIGLGLIKYDNSLDDIQKLINQYVLNNIGIVNQGNAVSNSNNNDWSIDENKETSRSFRASMMSFGKDRPKKKQIEENPDIDEDTVEEEIDSQNNEGKSISETVKQMFNNLFE